jgi:hypothetical protein
VHTSAASAGLKKPPRITIDSVERGARTLISRSIVFADMNRTDRLTPVVPDRQPTWTEIGIGVLVVIMLVSGLWSFDPISWTAVTLGILATWLVAGPVATSSVGERIDRWSEAAGLGVRIVVLVCVLAVLLAVATWLVPSWLANGFTLGLLLASLGWLCYHVVRAGGVSGWW